MAETKFICWDCLNKLKTLNDGELICSVCQQRYILVLQLVRVDDYNPSGYIEPHKDDPYP
jgi:hypothetical protein